MMAAHRFSALARLATDTGKPQIIAADAFLRLKDLRGQPVTSERLHRMIDQRNRLGPLWLSPDWMVAQAAPPSDRRTLADHAEAARRNPLARIMGRMVRGGGL